MIFYWLLKTMVRKAKSFYTTLAKVMFQKVLPNKELCGYYKEYSDCSDANNANYYCYYHHYRVGKHHIQVTGSIDRRPYSMCQEQPGILTSRGTGGTRTPERWIGIPPPYPLSHCSWRRNICISWCFCLLKWRSEEKCHGCIYDKTQISFLV